MTILSLKNSAVLRCTARKGVIDYDPIAKYDCTLDEGGRSPIDLTKRFGSMKSIEARDIKATTTGKRNGDPLIEFILKPKTACFIKESKNSLFTMTCHSPR